MSNDRCADRITCDVDCCSCHIKNSVDTHDQTDGFNRKSDRIKYHGQCYKNIRKFSYGRSREQIDQISNFLVMIQLIQVMNSSGMEEGDTSGTELAE